MIEIVQEAVRDQLVQAKAVEIEVLAQAAAVVTVAITLAAAREVVQAAVIETVAEAETKPSSSKPEFFGLSLNTNPPLKPSKKRYNLLKKEKI